MLKIRQRQLDALEESTQEALVLDVMERLQARYPEIALEPPDLWNSFIANKLSYASVLGLEGADSARFVEYHIEFGRQFMRDPRYQWVRSVLLDRFRAGDERIREIDDVYFR